MNLAKIIPGLGVQAHNEEWNDDKYIQLPIDENKELRWWQIEAYKKLKDAKFALIVAFCGSGKTILQVALAIYDVIKTKGRQKQLIIVPQSHIHKGFVGDGEFEYIPMKVEGELYQWQVHPNNFCNQHSKKVRDRLVAWLLTPPEKLAKSRNPNIITGVIAVASHQALCMAWATLSPAQKKQAIKNLTLRIDEAHHIKGVFDYLEEGLLEIERQIMEKESTQLGNICRFIFNSKSRTTKMCLTTATPFRGDRAIILSKSAEKYFEKYYLDWLKHWRTLGIKDFLIEYEEYDDCPITQMVNNIRLELREKHMIVIPSSTHKWREDGDPEVQELLRQLREIYPAERILDLVTKSTQKKNKALLLQEPKRADQGESKYDVIITCNLGREGTDWCPCSRVHNTACENSITLAVQTGGRPLRRYEGKTKVVIRYYVRRFVMPEKGLKLTKQQLLSDRINCLLVCMQIDEMCHPIIIPQIPGQSNEKEKDEDEDREERWEAQEGCSLAEVFGSQHTAMQADLIKRIEGLEVRNQATYSAVIKEIMEKYGVTENVEAVHDALMALVIRQHAPPELRLQGIDVTWLRENGGFDKVVEKFDIDTSTFFFQAYVDTAIWEELRHIVRHWAEYMEAALPLLKDKE